MAEGFEKQSGMKNQEGAGKGRSRGQAVNFLFTMLLFLAFVLCALFTVLIGGKVYENINRSKETACLDCAESVFLRSGLHFRRRL